MDKLERIYVVDALRGFAIISIMLLHNLEHFDFYYTPTNLPAWLLPIDKVIWDIVFFLFSGKSYAIFSLLFGLTFYIQDKRQQDAGNDFRLRFIWRLALLLVFGLINTSFYEGDILSIYAVLGLALVPIARMNTKAIIGIIIVLLLQPYEIYMLISGFVHPVGDLPDPASWKHFGAAYSYIPENSFWNTVIGNQTNGKMAVILWSAEVGRITQTIALFMMGFVAGRLNLFDSDKKIFWRKVLLFNATMFLPLYVFKMNIGNWFHTESIIRPLTTIISCWSNLMFMLVLVSSVYLLFHIPAFHKKIRHISPLGQMSMTNYLIQSILGSLIYYGFGLGLYKYTGATYALIIGIILAITQVFLSKWWLKSRTRGPFEHLWHRLTWL